MAGRTPKVAWGEEWMITSRKISSWEKTRDVRLEASSIIVDGVCASACASRWDGNGVGHNPGRRKQKKHEKTKEGRVG